MTMSSIDSLPTISVTASTTMLRVVRAVQVLAGMDVVVAVAVVGRRSEAGLPGAGWYEAGSCGASSWSGFSETTPASAAFCELVPVSSWGSGGVVRA